MGYIYIMCIQYYSNIYHDRTYKQTWTHTHTHTQNIDNSHIYSQRTSNEASCPITAKVLLA